MPGLTESLVSTTRAVEWWEYKLAPALASFYATALVMHRPLVDLWSGVMLLLLSLLPGAAYVSILNDLTDMREDEASGKVNRLARRSTTFRLASLAAPLMIGAMFFVLWRPNTWLVACYAAAWVSFTLYSAPPLRLKVRGLAGLLADSAGAHLFPSLLAALLAYHTVGVTPDGFWLSTLAAWSLGYGLRGIIWHQLLDRERDIAAAVMTFAVRHRAGFVAGIGKYVALPLEIVALAGMLWQLRTPIPLFFLLIYLLPLIVRARVGQTRLVAVTPVPGHVMIMHAYNHSYLPVALLLTSSLRQAPDYLLLLVHLALFPRGAWTAVQDFGSLGARVMRLRRV